MSKAKGFKSYKRHFVFTSRPTFT